MIVNDGQKGRRVWKIPEQSGWYGGGGARGSARVITREDNGPVSKGLVINQNDLPVTLTCTRHVSVLPEGSAASILMV